MKKLFFITIVLLSSCYVSKKLHTPATIRIKNNFEITLDACNDQKYINNNSKETYRSEFLNTLESELKEHNLTSQDSGKTDYELEIIQLKVQEDISTKTVNNEASVENGEKYEVHGCGVYFYGNLYKGEEKIGELKADASRSENISNSRTFWEWLLGLNKNHTSYHVKGMSSGVCQKLSSRCGRHTCAVITKKIVKGK